MTKQAYRYYELVVNEVEDSWYFVRRRMGNIHSNEGGFYPYALARRYREAVNAVEAYFDYLSVIEALIYLVKTTFDWKSDFFIVMICVAAISRYRISY